MYSGRSSYSRGSGCHVEGSEDTRPPGDPALARREPVPSDRLIEDLWAARPPATAAKVLHTYVSQLRKALGNDVILTRPGAYELHVEPVAWVCTASSASSPGAPQSAGGGGNLREALALWRGPPLAEFAFEPWAG